MNYAYAFLVATVVAAMSVCLPHNAEGKTRVKYDIREPKKAKSPKQLGDGEGALQISVRTQKQFTNTAIFYFVAVDDQGRDTDRVIRFERGAGVPFMGSNMIDEKQQIYRVPTGRYRPIAFTVACDQMPTAPGLVCTQGFGARYPTGFFAQGKTVFEVRSGELTRGGDFIIEYTGPLPAQNTSLLDVNASPAEWSIRWRESRGTADGFGSLRSNTAAVPETWHSRITCNARPEGVMLYIPFAC